MPFFASGAISNLPFQSLYLLTQRKESSNNGLIFLKILLTINKRYKMIQLRNTLIAAIAMALLTFTSSFAGSFAVGVSASEGKVEGDGSETESGGDAEVTKKSVSSDAVIGQIFAEYAFENNITFGFEFIPMEAKITDVTHSRGDAETSRTGTQTTVNSRLQVADAVLDDHATYYLELPLGPFYVKGGMVKADVITKETTDGANGGTYGNASIDGKLYGVGVRKMMNDNAFVKLEYVQTDYDDVNLTSTTGHKINADIDASMVNVRLGYKF